VAVRNIPTYLVITMDFICYFASKFERLPLDWFNGISNCSSFKMVDTKQVFFKIKGKEVYSISSFMGRFLCAINADSILFVGKEKNK